MPALASETQGMVFFVGIGRSDETGRTSDVVPFQSFREMAVVNREFAIEGAADPATDTLRGPGQTPPGGAPHRLVDARHLMANARQLPSSAAGHLQRSILLLQRNHGNRYVQRIADPESHTEEPASEPGQISRAVVTTRLSPAALVQRYESGEHAKMGETQAQLQANFAPDVYVVKKGESLESIAAQFAMTVQELMDANKPLLKTWPAADGSGRKVTGFSEGEKISIPKKLNDLAKQAVADPSAKITINGAVIDYGVAIAMGDLFESHDQMWNAPKAELEDIAALIKREQGGGTVSTDEWQKATKGRYLDLAAKNEAHFAPQNPALANASGAGASSANHKTEWEKNHRDALDISKSGDKDKALAANGFGDHFLTDSFAAGHLINKRDVMEQFNSQLTMTKGDFDKGPEKFFDDVAAASFTGAVSTEFSKYETVETHYGFHPNINSAGRFSTLLQGIHKKQPDLLSNAVAKGVHDKLNDWSGGVPVQNARGDAWNLSGDGTLNPKTLEIARAAVAQSQMNIIGAFKGTSTLDYTALFKKVWDFTPQPTTGGTAIIQGAVSKGTAITSPDLQTAVVNLIKANYMLIISELVKRGVLQLDK